MHVFRMGRGANGPNDEKTRGTKRIEGAECSSAPMQVFRMRRGTRDEGRGRGVFLSTQHPAPNTPRSEVSILCPSSPRLIVLSSLRPFVPTSPRPHILSSPRPFVSSSFRPYVLSSLRPIVPTSFRPLVPSPSRPFVPTSSRPFIPLPPTHVFRMGRGTNGPNDERTRGTKRMEGAEFSSAPSTQHPALQDLGCPVFAHCPFVLSSFRPLVPTSFGPLIP